jgi:fermentation-respiration switch protein FrsA (DUF1100 family)
LSVRRQISIPRGPFDLAADLHLPDGFDDSGLHQAVVLATPGSSVKEQIGANYAARLARRGLVALTFDPSHQGQSGGEPRDLEDPYRRGEDISFAIDALSLLPGIDPGRIGMLGICAGGGYAVHTARTEHRIRAIATVVAVNVGESFRGRYRAPDGLAASLDELARQRTDDVAVGRSTRLNWLPDTLKEAEALGITDVDTTAAITFYRESPAFGEYSTNRRLASSDALLVGYDAFHLVDPLLSQPLQVIVAGRRGSTGQYEMGHRLWEIAPNPVDLTVVDGAGHYEMYDVPRYVDQAVERLVSFYDEHL